MRTLLPAVAILTLTACGPDRRPAPAETESGGTLVMAAADADAIFHPLLATATGRAVADQLFQRLAEIGDDLNTVGDAGFEPLLAERWEWAADSLSILFHLRSNARWHDGRPVLAEDVRFTFDLLKDPATSSPVAALIGGVDSVEVVDSLSVRAWFAARSPTQFYDLVHHAPIVPRHVYESVPREELRTSPLMRQPVGSGPFRFVRWDAGSRIEIVADTAHWNGRPRLDRVIWAIVTDPGAGLARLLARDVDFLEFVPPDAVAEIERDTALRAIPYPVMQFVFLAMNQQARRGQGAHPIFGDRAVRQAVSMAVDRRAMLRNVYDTLGMLSYGPFPRRHAAADTNLALPEFDPRQANEILDQAGWARGADGIRSRGGQRLAFSMAVPATSRPRVRYSVLLQEALRQIGADVSVETVDFPTFISRQQAGDYDALLAGVATDPSLSSARQNFHSASIAGRSNFLRYRNPAFDATLDSALAASSADVMKELSSRAYRILIDDVPAVWLYDVVTVAGAHRRIRPERMRADAFWAHLKDWWIPDDERVERDRIGLGAPSQ
jgi:peptide/nickel transport system substrate-binding protein